jgi:hypothetical protein
MRIEGMSVEGYKLILQEKGSEIKRTCPKCGKLKKISQFGLRSMTGRKEIRIQSYCVSCREGY